MWAPRKRQNERRGGARRCDGGVGFASGDAPLCEPEMRRRVCVGRGWCGGLRQRREAVVYKVARVVGSKEVDGSCGGVWWCDTACFAQATPLRNGARGIPGSSTVAKDIDASFSRPREACTVYRILSLKCTSRIPLILGSMRLARIGWDHPICDPELVKRVGVGKTRAALARNSVPCHTKCPKIEICCFHKNTQITGSRSRFIFNF